MLIGIPGRRAHLRFAVESVGASGKKLGAEAEFVFVRSKDDAGVQGDWAPVAVRAGSDSAWVLALPDPPSDLEAPRMAGRKLGAGGGGGGFLGIGHLSATALLCSGGGMCEREIKRFLELPGEVGEGLARRKWWKTSMRSVARSRPGEVQARVYRRGRVTFSPTLARRICGCYGAFYFCPCHCDTMISSGDAVVHLVQLLGRAVPQERFSTPHVACAHTLRLWRASKN